MKKFILNMIYVLQFALGLLSLIVSFVIVYESEDTFLNWLALIVFLVLASFNLLNGMKNYDRGNNNA